MYSSVLSTPVRRTAAAVGAAVALAATALALAPGAQANAFAGRAGSAASGSHHGTATATVLRTGLDVGVLHHAVDVPLDVTLDDVSAPADASRTALAVRLDGVNGGHPFSLLSADVATARATAGSHTAEGYVNLVDARVELPGLPLPLLRVQQVTSRATCPAGRHATASSNVLGAVSVAGRPVTLTAGGSTTVRVAAVGEVRLTLSSPRTTARTAAATALDLSVSIDPLGLGLTTVDGDITLARATCRAPSGGTGGGGSSSGGSSGTGGSTSGTSGGGGSSGNGGSGNGGSSSGTSGSGSSGASAGTSGSGGTGGSAGGTAASGGADSGGGSASGSSGSQGSSGGTGAVTPTGQDHGLADTGAGSSTPCLAAGAAALLACGGVTLRLTRRRGNRTGR